MRNCPVCGESFGDELNFCDIDGAPLERDPADVAQAKNKLWSILGIVLVVGALAISALSVIFIPRGHGPTPAIVSSQPAPPTENKLATAETPATADTTTASAEPEAIPPSEIVPEVKRKEMLTGHENGNLSKSAKQAAKEAEEPEQPVQPQPPVAVPDAPKKPDTTAVKPVNERREGEQPSISPSPSTDPKAAGKTTANSNSKKKDEEKDKKKGGFFKVFKKIFSKD